ncbi:MAG: formylmethionine deformylase [Mycobacterium sp.]|jgi:peptide deformylase|nr:formylmethionine deformylase [Mycobacterium sp.]
MIRPVIHAPNPVLSRPSAPVDPDDPEVIALAVDLVETMRASPGCVGLAAPQLGEPVRVFALDVTGHPKARSCAGLVVLANPVVVELGELRRGREGCMSVPDFTGDVGRPRTIVVRGFVPGPVPLPRVVEADAFEARAFAHELDHLDGLLFLDRVLGADAVHPRKRYL